MKTFLGRLTLSSRRSALLLFLVSAAAGSGIMLELHDSDHRPTPSSASR